MSSEGEMLTAPSGQVMLGCGPTVGKAASAETANSAMSDTQAAKRYGRTAFIVLSKIMMPLRVAAQMPRLSVGSSIDNSPDFPDFSERANQCRPGCARRTRDRCAYAVASRASSLSVALACAWGEAFRETNLAGSTERPGADDGTAGHTPNRDKPRESISITRSAQGLLCR